MNSYHEARVSRALIHHFCIKTNERFRELRLRDELGLEPLDLVLFVLDLEHSESPPFDFDALGEVVTVGDLVALVGTWFKASDDALRQHRAHDIDRVA